MRYEPQYIVPMRIALAVLCCLTAPVFAQEASDPLTGENQPLATLPAIPCTNEPGKGPEMIVIEAGRFTMGSPDNEPGRNEDEGPQRDISIVRPFAMARCETTVAEFRLFVEETGYETEAEAGDGCYELNDAGTDGEQRKDRHWREPGFAQTDTHPMVCVSWNDAMAYAQWLSQRTGLNYRLPSEAEWEYVARAGSRTSRFWGNEANAECAYANAADQALKRRYPDYAWPVVTCNDGVIHTAPAGSFIRNAFGLSDMLGNVWEWVSDCYQENLVSVPADGTAWDGADGEACAGRMIRGGGWFGTPDDLRSSDRDRLNPDDASVDVGFRLARDL